MPSADAQVQEDTGIPTHKPVIAQLDIARYVQMVPTIKQPIAFPIESWPKLTQKEKEKTEEGLAEDVLKPRPPLPNNASVEQMWQDFCEISG